MSVLTSRDLLLLPQTAQHAPPRVTSTHMPSALCEKLVLLCNQYQIIISDNGNSMDCRMKRRSIWVEISKQLNQEFGVEFTPEQYKKKYQNLKTALKAKMMHMRGSPDSKREHQCSSTIASLAANVMPTHISCTSVTSPMSVAASVILQHPTTLHDTSAMESIPAASSAVSADVKPTIPALILPPQVNTNGGQQLDVQTLLINFLDRDRVLSPEESGLGPSHAERPENAHPASSTGSSDVTDLMNITDLEPTKIFCMSLNDSLHRIRGISPLVYAKLRKAICVLIFDAEIEILNEFRST